MKLNQILALPIGLLLLAIALLMGKFLPENNFLDFTEGLLMGLSAVLNIWFIYIMVKNSKNKLL